MEPDEDGSIEVEIEEEGSSIVIKFEEEADETISVGPVEVKACAEPGKYHLSHSANSEALFHDFRVYITYFLNCRTVVSSSGNKTIICDLYS